MSIPLLEPDSLFDGRYIIIEPVGAGRTGQVYKARQAELERIVAIKVLDPARQGSFLDQQRLELEAQILSQLNHPNIASCYSFRKVDPFFYMATEFVEGISLRDKLNKAQKIPASEINQICIQICDALSYAHQLGIIHRDLKPENLMLGKNPTDPERTQIKLIDFGLAKWRDDSGKTIKELTESGLIVGTVNYLSPENCAGKKVDHRSDLYAVGCILFEALAGKPPYSSESPLSTIMKHVNEPIPSLLELAETTNKETDLYDRVIRKALAKDPNDRYQSASELRDDLLKVASGEHETLMLRLPERRKRSSKCKNAVTIVSILIAAAATCTIAFQFAINKKASKTSQPESVNARDARQVAAQEYIHKGELYLQKNKNDSAARMFDKALWTIALRFPKTQLNAKNAQIDLDILKTICVQLKDGMFLSDVGGKLDQLRANDDSFLTDAQKYEGSIYHAILRMHSDFANYNPMEENEICTELVYCCETNSARSMTVLNEFEKFMRIRNSSELIAAQRKVWFKMGKSYIFLNKGDQQNGLRVANEAYHDLQAIKTWSSPLLRSRCLDCLAMLYIHYPDEQDKAESCWLESLSICEKNRIVFPPEQFYGFYLDRKPNKAKLEALRKRVSACNKRAEPLYSGWVQNPDEVRNKIKARAER